LEERVEQAARAAVDLVGAEPLSAGTYDVVCDGPLAALWAHETLGHLAEADYQLGDPAIAAALEPGRRIGPRTLTVSDGPGPATARGHTPVDDEGTAGREIALVERGVVAQARLHDRATAAAFHEQPTGNARALSFRHRPLPRLRTTRVHAGPDTLDAMIAGIGRGVLARGLLGGQTDRLGFSFTPAECLLIRDGQVRGPVRGVVLSGEIFDSLRRISGIGDQVCTADTSASCGKQGQWPLPVSCWSPPIALRGLHVVP
jgi:TldD protein